MKFEYQIQESEFIKLKYFLYYRNPVTIFAIISFLIIAFINLRNFFVFNKISQFDVFFSIMSFYFLILHPIINYFRFKKEYRSSKVLQQKVLSEITDEKIRDISDESEAEASWKTVHKVEETKNWFIIYYSNNMFGLSPKRVMTKNQIQGLREIVLKNVVKAKLRND